MAIACRWVRALLFKAVCEGDRFTFLLKETGPAAHASPVPLPVAQREAT
jgi:hypothetical protein